MYPGANKFFPNQNEVMDVLTIFFFFLVWSLIYAVEKESHATQ